MPSFLQRFRRSTLESIFSDQTWVSIHDGSLAWLDLPPQEFLDYARSARRTPYDGVKDDPSIYRREATFLIAQSHRIWLTLNMIAPYIADSPSFTLLDVGAFPFALDEAIRFYLRRNCRIIATVAQKLSAEELECLQQASIETIPVNLDPRVRMESPLPGMTDYLPLPDNSVDAVLFAHVIEHLYHPIQILREMVRVLKPGGRLLLTTDHGMLLGGFLNYINDGKYLHEPVETTAAMVFHEWRGHVRFYTEGDLRTLLEAAGARVVRCELREVLYNSVPEEYFVDPFVQMPRWRANLLSEFPAFRNEILILAEKDTETRSVLINPLDTTENGKELRDLAADFSAGNCNLTRATRLDLAFGCRLLWGRWPSAEELRKFLQNPPVRGVDELVQRMLGSPEFQARAIGVQYERPGASCIIMTETEEGHRFFFSAQDTFVGFPVAVGVFEPEVRAALDRIVRPGINCVDVGANIGYHTVRMASVARQGGGKVWSIEPDPFNFSLLLRNLKENSLEEAVVPLQVACGDEEGQVSLIRDLNPSNFGGTHTRKQGQSSYSNRLIGTVPLRRLDDLIPHNEVVHLVKIDVEGFEPFVLRGMAGRIQQDRPVIVCEFNTPALEQWGSDGPDDFLRLLDSYGYDLFEAGSFARGETTKFQSCRETPIYANLVCIPRERQQEWVSGNQESPAKDV